MNKLTQVLEATLIPVMNKISNQRHLAAVRDGLIATIPLTIIGAIFLLIPTFPWPQSYVEFMGNNPKIVSVLMIPFQLTLGLLSVYVAFGIGNKLAKSYGYDGLSGGISATLTFFTTIGFTTLEEGSFLSTAYLGGEGMFTAIISAFFAVEIIHLCDKLNWKIKLPDSVPPNVGSSFDSLIPITISVSLMAVIVHWFGFDINQLISTLITPLLGASSDSIFLPLIYVTLTALMWFVGMHPAILAAVVTPIWMVNATANMDAVVAGTTIPHIGVQPFIFTFLWIGGGGGTLALCLYMCFSKSKSLKSLGRLSIVPSLFNINEPILFGVPIVLNPILIIPFLLGPIICTIITYIGFTSGLVQGMGYPLAAAWNFPAFIAAPLCTAHWSGAVLVVVNFIVYCLIYYPFFKVFEKRTLEEERGLENEV